MGLTIIAIHERVVWSYSGFHEFRKVVARAINIDLDNMAGFCIVPKIPGAPFPWKPYQNNIIARALLNHSDCDGIIDAQDCAPLAAELRGILPKLADDWHHKQCQKLINVLAEAGELKIEVEFC